MKDFLLVLIALLFFSTSLFADYKLESVHCTEKKKSNCGAYLYNTKTGATYFCDTEKCEEVMPAIEDVEENNKTISAKKNFFIKYVCFKLRKLDNSTPIRIILQQLKY